MCGKGAGWESRESRIREEPGSWRESNESNDMNRSNSRIEFEREEHGSWRVHTRTSVFATAPPPHCNCRNRNPLQREASATGDEGPQQHPCRNKAATKPQHKGRRNKPAACVCGWVCSASVQWSLPLLPRLACSASTHSHSLGECVRVEGVSPGT